MLLMMIKWVAFSGLVMAILPMSVEHPWRYMGATFFATIAIIFAKAEGMSLAKERMMVEGDEGGDEE
jgi:hypothetical protein